MLTLAEIKEVFDSWREQAQADEKAMQLWNVLYDDLRMAAEAKEKKQ